MARKGLDLALMGFFCLLPLHHAAAQPREGPASRLNRPSFRPEAVQPPGPCSFSFAGRWFGDNQILYEVGQEAGRLTWSVPALGAQARGGCEGETVWAAWHGPLGQGVVRGRVEGHPGGSALLIRWSDQRTFARIPDLAVAADRDSVRKGEQINFFGRIDPPESPVSRYFIDFGDGQEHYYEAPSARHVYENAGVFDVVLTAIVFDQRFPGPPFQIRVVEPESRLPLVASLLLEVDRRSALVGEGLRVRSFLDPETPGAEYSFTFGDQVSPWLSSPFYEFRCDSEGIWVARAMVRLPGAVSQLIESEPIEVSVQVPAPAGGSWLVWLVPSGVVVAGLALTCRGLYRKKREREQARMRARLNFERHFDSGEQSIQPEPERLCRTELLLQPGLDPGRQRADGLSVKGERRVQ